jgi:ABC-type branched-subunit amino acid transport system ATPase component
MAISDNILVLHNGAPLAEGTPSVIQNNDEVIRVYLGTGFEHAAPSRKP